jgi:type VI secretion system protein ImpJ
MELYQLAIQLAAEMVTFVKHQRRPVGVSSYDHKDLRRTFTPLLMELRQLLRVHRQQVIQLPLKERGYGIFLVPLNNRERQLLESANFVLEVCAQVTAETLKELFSDQMTIGPMEKIAHLVNLKQSGINLTPLSETPSGLTEQSHSVYFQLDNRCPGWQQLSTSKGLAFHITEEIADFKMRLWIITA